MIYILAVLYTHKVHYIEGYLLAGGCMPHDLTEMGGMESFSKSKYFFTLYCMFSFNKKYFLAAVILFVIEVLIALYVNDAIIRPYVGDFLVVMLLYCSVQAFFRIPCVPAAIGVLLFAYLIEILQYFQIIHRLGLQHSKLATVIIGSSFEWIDIIAYTAGVAFILTIDRKRKLVVKE